ncbi:MAG: uracil-DNA glycosylase [Candidatus Krumholzibacteria bacterium]|nr:uracil-DNA glycosylase [Candidatus Krumholzibacteria bacterium]
MQSDLFDTEYNEILAAKTYGDFHDRLAAYDCRRCTLCHSRGQIVIDRGDPDTAILLISERPGVNEDMVGKPFVGRAGELLDKMLAAIDLDSNKDVLIANVTKCMPDTDRAPTRPEVDACIPYLEKQIELAAPRVIVILGAVALKWFDPSRSGIKMEDEAGKLFELPQFRGIQFVVLYNPAFLLRDPNKKQVTWEHLKSLRRFLTEAS